MACHSERATCSKSKSKKIKVKKDVLKPRRPKNRRFNPAGKTRLDLMQQKEQTVALETKDSWLNEKYLIPSPIGERTRVGLIPD
jgi:hypothetical protein